MTVEANHIAPQRSRLLYPGFIFSLALNLLFIGGVAAAVWHHHNAQERRNESGLLSFARQLPPDRQEAFRQQVFSARASMKSERDKVRMAWRHTNDVLTTEPFDKEKFKAAMADLRAVEDQFRTGINAAFADIAASLTPSERKLLQGWREKRRPKFLRRDKDTEQSNDRKSD
ncbi:periplasmic heavy metal sensor [Hyphomicrobium sp.]|uniref:periplasmic heavy metal sensor n=1 Tax=Hyphomicrobium sp. TaxID=82 RepID=UPI002C51E276|nr:periplasmic heavy metal sensor [Hyphomicrobium sp.]HVZ05159.1 periplasmic heavy metal sensor [Hyphomicrobium sp.]